MDLWLIVNGETLANTPIKDKKQASKTYLHIAICLIDYVLLFHGFSIHKFLKLYNINF